MPHPLMLAVLLLTLAGQASFAEDAEVALDRCLSEEFPARVEAKFRERFPHERCDTLTDCKPELLKSAEVLARRICRSEAIDHCFEQTDANACLETLAQRWEQKTTVLRDDMRNRWARIDRTSVSAFAMRRFDAEDTYLPTSTTCPDLRELGLAEGLLAATDQDVFCRNYQAFSEIERAESLEGYLSSVEDRDDP